MENFKTYMERTVAWQALSSDNKAQVWACKFFTVKGFAEHHGVSVGLVDNLMVDTTTHITRGGVVVSFNLGLGTRQAHFTIEGYKWQR